MTTSKEVFAARREGKLDEAYKMAVQRMGAPDKSEWDDRALGWCLVDLIKRECSGTKTSNFEHYIAQLKALTVTNDDEILSQQRDRVLQMATPLGGELEKAKQLSKAGRHSESADIYRAIVKSNPQDTVIVSSLGWELYRLAKSQSEDLTKNLTSVKRLLHEYLQLGGERPSLLHSCMLLVANRLAGASGFSSIAFSRMWGLENLQESDWDTFTTDLGHVVSSNAERLIQHAAKDAIAGNDHGALEYILPYVEEAQTRHPENFWLNLHHARVLLGLGRKQEALDYAITVAKRKPNEYWIWELLGDLSLVESEELARSCYCRALLCGAQEGFIGKVRLKLAALLSKCNLYGEAKCEVERVVADKERHGYKLPVEVENLRNSDWYRRTEAVDTNRALYQQYSDEANELLISDLPCIDATFGGSWCPGDRPAVQKFYIQHENSVRELSDLAAKYSSLNLKPGAPISIRGEWVNEHHFQIYKVVVRNAGEYWDVTPAAIGIVDHVNYSKKLLHFIVDKKQDGVIRFSELKEEFSVGDPISVRLAAYRAGEGMRLRILEATRTEKPLPSHLLKTFEEKVNVMDAGFGKTESGIFLPPQLVKKEGLSDGQVVEGEAIISFDKKWSRWGWSALRVSRAV